MLVELSVERSRRSGQPASAPAAAPAVKKRTTKRQMESAGEEVFVAVHVLAVMLAEFSNCQVTAAAARLSSILFPRSHSQRTNFVLKGWVGCLERFLFHEAVAGIS